MPERPILFSAPMVCAILDGSKTQTRRVLTHGTLWRHTGVTPAPERGPFYLDDYGHLNCKYITAGESMFKDGINRCAVLVDPGKIVKCPYGKPGDRLWVREAWKAPKTLDAFSGKVIGEKALDAGYTKPWAPLTFLADGRVVNGDVLRAGTGEFGKDFGRYRHARFMPRWASRITLEITEIRVERLQDISEADAIAEGIERTGGGRYWRSYKGGGAFGLAVPSYASLWDSINGEGAWGKNPWVWAVSFRRVGGRDA